MKHSSFSSSFNCLKAALILATVTLSCGASAQTETQTNYSTVVDEINEVMHQNHYNPKELSSPGYLSMLEKMKSMAEKVSTKKEFVSEFNDMWKSGPFSHVNLGESGASVTELAAYFDNMEVGPGGAQLTWDNDIAILTINTMMGLDTIKYIQEAYKEITKKNAKALIIDLRNNEGGAFAIRPLVAHLIDKPLQTGFFISQKWSKANSSLPNEADLKDIASWTGWSIRAFWEDVQTTPIIKVTFEPSSNTVDIPTYILTSNKTASASELATEALQKAGRVKVIGEATAGQMLSQKPFDLSGGLQLFVPIADYYSVNTGRLEGNPITPDFEVSKDKAMEFAIEQISKL